MIRLKGGLVGGFGPSHFAFETRRTLASAVRAGVEAATGGLKAQIRDQVVGVGLGTRLANAVGSKVYPESRKASLHPTGMVFPRGPLAEKIFEALNEGAPIRARNSRYLAIPTRNAWLGGPGGKRPTPRLFEQRTGVNLFVVESKRPGVLLLMGRVLVSRSYRIKTGRHTLRVGGTSQGKTSVVYFILVPMVRPGPRLTFDLFARRWADRIPDFIERATPENLR